MKRPITYPDRLAQWKHSLGFATKPLTQDWALVGTTHVALTLALNPGATDTAIFAYLDNYNPVSGVANYITEGCIRAVHRASTNNNNNNKTTHVGAFDTIERSYLMRDMLALEDWTTVEFSLEPVAYLVPKGNVLRFSLAGADTDNYYLENIKGLAQSWRIDASRSELLKLNIVMSS
ncbi:Putative serine esterase [Seminavis robusta]|uniref:Serine esterase n=1 Tax=Seminavis robusta TaxID=568900 RepID=A0A9N8E8L1_9STRA|nr:Putative serine esterase [Seminavis robusta]|eukprot:Sro613_g175650.1 Putative serine esterase (177) ;mRNA; f:42161-42691